MFAEEKPALRPLPAERFRYFKQETRTVNDSGLVQVLQSYYAAAPAPLYSDVTVRIYDHDIEILDAAGSVLRRHARSTVRGSIELPDAERIYNPSRESAQIIGKVSKLGPHSAKLQLMHQPSGRYSNPSSVLEKPTPFVGTSTKLMLSPIGAGGITKPLLQRRMATFLAPITCAQIRPEAAITWQIAGT